MKLRQDLGIGENTLISNKKTIDNKMLYWVADIKNNKILKEKFQRQELFAIEYNFE